MHNGMRVLAGAYHGEWMAIIIGNLRGHHEPQEECIFHHLVRSARHGSVMVELASFWAYYAIWYLQCVPSSRALCVEPDPNHMAVGRSNAALNGVADRIRFVEAWVGGESRAAHTGQCESTGMPRTLACLDMDAVMEALGEHPIELLHMDAQGAELGFIRSMRRVVERSKIRFVMVSTHHASISGSPSTHADCLTAIRDLGGVVLVEFDVPQSFSGDGLIVASFCQEDRSLPMPPITRNRREASLFSHG
jgi:FkbM family methyltransferase